MGKRLFLTVRAKMWFRAVFVYWQHPFLVRWTKTERAMREAGKPAIKAGCHLLKKSGSIRHTAKIGCMEKRHQTASG